MRLQPCSLRSTTRRCRWLALVAALVLVLSVLLPPVGPTPALASSIIVSTTADESADPGPGTGCSLREAIEAANRHVAFGGCTAGSGSDTIVLQAGQTYALSTRDNTQFGFNGTPIVRSTITIEGNGATITRANGAPSFRLFHVAKAGDTFAGGTVAISGSLTLHNVTLSNGAAVGGAGGRGKWGGGGAAGMGGAIYVRGTLTVNQSTFQGNVAQGGNGGSASASSGGSGGGGGLGGAGGSGSSNPGNGGGGGGGFGGAGGSGAAFNTGSGEGGGIVADGVSGSGSTNGSGGSVEGGDADGFPGGFGGGGGGGTGGGDGGTGGGGGGTSGVGGDAGFGGGGGGGGIVGGFGGIGGGGGGGAQNPSAPNGGFGAGQGGVSSTGASGGGGAGVGGAIFNDGGTVTLTNSTLSGNSAVGGAGGGTAPGAGQDAGHDGEGRGGAVFTFNATTTILASTIASNTASQGGAVEWRNDNGDVTHHIGRSIVADSVGPEDCFASSGSSGSATWGGIDNLIEADPMINAVSFACGGAVSTADPQLEPLAVVSPGQTPVHALPPTSPAVNAVAGACPETTDQRGVGRPQGARCDIGAFERSAGDSQFQSDLSITKTDNRTVVGTGQPTTYTIVASNAGPSLASNARVLDGFPATLTGVSWSCAASSGSSCPASGSGTIDTLVTIAVGGSVTFTATGTLSNAAAGTLVNNASVTVPAGYTDPNTGNNVATDTDTIVSCSPRPRVGVSTTHGGGALTVTLTAGAGAISSVQFGDGAQHPGGPTNAVIAVTSPPGGPSGITSAQTYTPPSGTTSVALRITRPGAGAMTVPLVVADACGAWRTFVGAGAGAAL